MEKTKIKPIKINLDYFVNKSREIHTNQYDYSLINYINCYKKVKIICKKHGEFLQSPTLHLRGSGCPRCATERVSNNHRLNTLEFIEKSNRVHGIGKYDYSMSVYIGSNCKIKIGCITHGIFEQSAINHLAGHGCKKCKNSQLSHRKTYTTEKFIEESNIIHSGKYDYTNVDYSNCYDEVEILCKKHGTFWQKPYIHLQRHGCPSCGKISSHCENDFLNYIGILTGKKFRQVNINRMLVDGYDSGTNTIYEFLGDYWHGNPNKYNMDDINRVVNMKFKDLYIKTFNRFNRLSEFGYTIKYIWEDDWKLFVTGLVKLPNIIVYKKLTIR